MEENTASPKGRIRKKIYTAKQIIKKAYGNSNNFMSPKILSYGKLGKSTAFELSHGNGIEPGTEIYGVSVAGVTAKGKGVKIYKLSTCFPTNTEAKEYVKSLKQKFKRE